LKNYTRPFRLFVSAFILTDNVTLRERSSRPKSLYEKAKRLGIWNPSDIDFSKDTTDWSNLKDDEKDLILRLLAMFVAGEEAITLDLLPLMRYDPEKDVFEMTSVKPGWQK
jgi:ribonucleotide reductase beta subunit family protein with ferritin-like domain